MTLEELKEDYDWQQALCYAPFDIKDIVEIVAISEGYNDGESWVGVFKLANGNYGFIDAWCDYTGWDCQAGGDGFVNSSLDELRRWSMNSNARRRLGLALSDLDEIPNKP
jgi:hypothetical protein